MALELAGARIHGTMQKRPYERFEAVERAALLPLPSARYELAVWKAAAVHQDSHIVFERAMYSVPWRFIGKSILVWSVGATVSSLQDDLRIATHERAAPDERRTVEAYPAPLSRTPSTR